MKGIRALALILALAMLLSLGACAKDGADQSGTGEENPAGTGSKPAPATEEADPWAERDMTGVVEGWRGRGDTGKVETPGEYAATIVKSLSDLAPYRAFFPDLNDADAARITSDEDGVAVVLEVASTDLTLLYSVDTVTREEESIVFQVMVAPEIHEPQYDENGAEVEFPDPGSPYEYFLFYIPTEEYHEEDLLFQFA